MRWSPASTVWIALVLACTSSAPDFPAIRAFGNEPFWNVTLFEVDGIVFKRLAEEPITFPYEAPAATAGDGTTWLYGPVQSGSDEHEIEIRISEEDCQDTMADVIHSMRATVILDGEELTGCARRLDDNPPRDSP